MRPAPRRPFLALASALLPLALIGCGPQAAAPDAPPTPTVEVLAVEPRPLAQSQELPGRVTPVRIAEVRARVAGILVSRHYEEGAEVKAGQLLFRIDAAPYEVALAKARAELARTAAAEEEAESVVRRYAPLAKVDAVSQQDFDAAQSTLKSARAARLAAQADVDAARLNLGYTAVVAPIAGRIGRALASEGALVGQGEATALATIQQLHPIYVDFTQPVSQLVASKTTADAGAVVLTASIDGTERQRDGRLRFTDASVDPSTGQVVRRGEFANTDGLLLPGMFVRVKVADAAAQSVLLVPQRAVKRSADGKPHVLVVGTDGKVQDRAVELGATVGKDWHVTRGLNARERVIVGGPAVAPGEAVVVAPAASASAAGASSR